MVANCPICSKKNNIMVLCDSPTGMIVTVCRGGKIVVLLFEGV